jgi:hypothetical protein
MTTGPVIEIGIARAGKSAPAPRQDRDLREINTVSPEAINEPAQPR